MAEKVNDEASAEEKLLLAVILDNCQFFALWHQWRSKHDIKEADMACCQLSHDFLNHVKMMELNYLKFMARSDCMAQLLGPLHHVIAALSDVLHSGGTPEVMLEKFSQALKDVSIKH